MLSKSRATLIVACYTNLAFGGVINVSQANTPGTNCTSEGLLQCIQQTNFQQCRWGNWSEIGAVQQGSRCDFHGELDYMAFALMPSDIPSLQSNQKRDGTLLVGRDDARHQDEVRFEKRDLYSTDITSSPLYHGNDEEMQTPGKRDLDREQSKEANHIEARAGNSLVAEPRAQSDTCLSSKSKKRSSKKELTPIDQAASIAERALRNPSYIVCGTLGLQFSAFFPYEFTNARGRAIKARMYYFNNYPKPFNNYENINMNGCTGQLYEFPVFEGGAVYGNTNDWNPGADSVIIDCQGNICAVITHTGAPAYNSFVPYTYYP
ncbi:hypothetical protein JMJ35_007701 [Cladonia borealis]|uniref:Uncharacterized protein n=1 Tax=Cladonia borealis TaxID=184061 RepID=A0AA39QW22_9LECA|nr:hypothetical protein JMJ35_007701 [Cladonia borealis]